MATLLIPWGLVNGKVKAVKDITEKDKDNITCMHCGEKLILKAIDSNFKTKHLSHKSDSKCPYKSKESMKKAQIHESYEHKYMKFFLRDNLKYFREKGIKPEIINGEFKLTGYRDLKIKQIELEKPLTPNYKPDLTIITDKKTICLEIYKTNRKDPQKLKEILAGIPVSVYEVDINRIDEVTMQNIFKNMKLIYSDIKNVYDAAVEKMHKMIINNRDEVKQLKNYNLALENEIAEYRHGSRYNSNFDKILWKCKDDGAELYTKQYWGYDEYLEIDSILFEEYSVCYNEGEPPFDWYPVYKTRPRAIYGSENIKNYILGEDKTKIEQYELLDKENQALKEEIERYKAEISKRGDEIVELEAKVAELEAKARNDAEDIERMTYTIDMLKLRLDEEDYDVKTGEFI